MSRGPGHVMRGIEAYLDTLPPGALVGHDELAHVVYGVEQPTRAQLSAIGRAVGRLVEQGKAERFVTVVMTGQWEKPVPGKPDRPRWERPLVRRGPIVQRKTLVWRGS